MEAVIRGLVAQQDHQRISSLLHLLVHDFALSPQSNHRKVESPQVLPLIKALLLDPSLWHWISRLYIWCVQAVKGDKK